VTLDIDFLTTDKPKIRRDVIYVLQSGTWRIPVLKRIRSIALSREKELSQVSSIFDLPTEMLMPSIFGGKTVFYDSPGNEKSDEIERLLGFLSGEHDNALVLFISEVNGWVGTEAWDQWMKSGHVTLIEEISFRKGNIKKTLPLILPMISTYDFKKLNNLDEFLKAIEGWVGGDQSKCSLLDLLDHLEMVSLVFISSRTDLFDAKKYLEEFPQGAEGIQYFQLHRLISNFLKNKSQDNKTALLVFIAKEYLEGENPGGRVPQESMKKRKGLVGLIYRVVKDLMIINKFLNPQRVFSPEWSQFKIDILEKLADGVSHLEIYKFSMHFMKSEPDFYKVRPVMAMSKFLGKIHPVTNVLEQRAQQLEAEFQSRREEWSRMTPSEREQRRQEMEEAGVWNNSEI
jgi:hypothetical protein